MCASENDFCQVSLDESRQVASLVWKKEVTLSEYQEGGRKLATLFATHQICRCLIESTNRGNLAREVEEWSRILKNHNSCSPGPLQVALVMSEARYQQQIYAYSLHTTQVKDQPIQFNYFTNIEEAMDWLRQEHTYQV